MNNAISNFYKNARNKDKFQETAPVVPKKLIRPQMEIMQRKKSGSPNKDLSPINKKSVTINDKSDESDGSDKNDSTMANIINIFG